MGHEVSADLVIGCADEVDEVGINTGLMQLGHQQGADCARFGCRLEQGGAPSGEGVDETGCGDGVGEVPWSCDEHDRMRLPLQMRAGLFVLQLVHENTAAATMFGIDRLDRDKDVNVLFYNMGAMDTEVSIVKYSTITEMPANKTHEHVEILAEAWDKNMGGGDLDKILLDMLATRFNSMKERKDKPDIRENPKAIKRLLKEVIKMKDILSANKQVQVKLGELADYVTLSTIITRKEFEE